MTDTNLVPSYIDVLGGTIISKCIRKVAVSLFIARILRTPVGGLIHPFFSLTGKAFALYMRKRYAKGYPLQVDGVPFLGDPAFFATHTVPHDGDNLRLILDVVNPGDIVLDVGGWIGVYAICLGKSVGKDGKVYSFEPAPDSMEIIKKHIKLNALENVIEPVAAACGDTAGEFLLRTNALSSENRLLGAKENSEVAIRVQTIKLDDFVVENSLGKVDVIKIDVEGAELQVLRGARQILLTLSPTVYVEMHPRLWEIWGTTFEKITEFAASCDYHIEKVGDRPNTSIYYIKLFPNS